MAATSVEPGLPGCSPPLNNPTPPIQPRRDNPPPTGAQ